MVFSTEDSLCLKSCNINNFVSSHGSAAFCWFNTIVVLSVSSVRKSWLCVLSQGVGSDSSAAGFSQLSPPVKWVLCPLLLPFSFFNIYIY